MFLCFVEQFANIFNYLYKNDNKYYQLLTFTYFIKYNN